MPRPGAARASESESAAMPRDFVWGVSTSSYQVEGAARADGRGLSIWDVFSRKPGGVANGDTGDVACDHYHRYGEDVALMRELGVGAYRFSVAWPRILPLGRGAPNAAGLDFYDRLIDALLAAGIEPWLCLYHWDLPQALAEAGGWAARDSAGWFADYAAIVADRYGDRVRRFATFNEPCIFALFGYGFGGDPPCEQGIVSLARATHHVNLAHGAAVDVLRARVVGASIGAVHNRQPMYPATATPQAAEACTLFDAWWNGAFPDPQCLGRYPSPIAAAIAPFLRPGDLDRIRRPLDWIGINHYSPIWAKDDPNSPLGFGFGDAPAAVPRTGLGWPIDASAFRDTLAETHGRYGLPIYVTENGYGAYEPQDGGGGIADGERIAYLRDYPAAMRVAIAAGADVRGYFVWSLLDNFEWREGYRARFGIVQVDYATLRRIPKASFRWYADLIRRSAPS